MEGPMIVELTAEGRFESGLDALVEGKRFAFLAVIGERYAARLGAAVEGEPGYYPVPEVWAHSDCMKTLQDHADRLNAHMGLSREDAARVVASTFAAGKVQRPQPDAAARKRLTARLAARKRQNPTLERVIGNPPPIGTKIRFTDFSPQPSTAEPSAVNAWNRSNGIGEFFAAQTQPLQITLRIGAGVPGRTPTLRTFEASCGLAFYVEGQRSSRPPFEVSQIATPPRAGGLANRSAAT